MGEEMLRKAMMRWIFNTPGVLVVGCFALLASTQVKSRIFRHRAEQLRVEVWSLEAGKSTWADVRAIQSRWGSWGHYSGTCNAKSCDYQISLGSSFEPSRVRTSFASLMHDHQPRLDAVITVRNGIVTESYLRFWVQVPYGFEPSWNPKYFETGQDSSIKNGYLLIATTGSTNEFDPNCCQFSPRKHPQYSIGQFTTCMQGLSVRTEYAPTAEQEIRLRMTDFNLDCATRWAPCAEEMDIFPEVWRQHVNERAEPERLDDYIEAPGK